MNVNIRGKCNSCCVPGCKSNSLPSLRNRGGRITTFKLPRDEARRKEWIQAIPKRKYTPTVHHNVCILHFNEEDFSRNNRRIDLKKSAVPSIFPFVDGQTMDETSDLCDEVWIEYVAHKEDAMSRPLHGVDKDIPTSASDISRILIERLRIPGAKYFGIDTAEITIQPDLDMESDSCEPKATARPKKRIRKSIKCDDDDERPSSFEFNDDFDDIDMKDSPPAVDDTGEKPVLVNPNESVNSTGVSDNEDKFGAMVSSKLLLMPPLQQLMSQKIINEILLRGQLGMLKSALSPVLVNGYMKNASNAVSKTTMNNTASTDCLSWTSDGSEQKYLDGNDTTDSDDCDPLMCQVKHESVPNTKSFEFIKDEYCSSDDVEC